MRAIRGRSSADATQGPLRSACARQDISARTHRAAAATRCGESALTGMKRVDRWLASIPSSPSPDADGGTAFDATRYPGRGTQWSANAQQILSYGLTYVGALPRLGKPGPVADRSGADRRVGRVRAWGKASGILQAISGESSGEPVIHRDQPATFPTAALCAWLADSSSLRPGRRCAPIDVSADRAHAAPCGRSSRARSRRTRHPAAGSSPRGWCRRR
jgi:hypothetical protein